MEKFELHYYLADEIHSMDAFVKNKAEAEVLKIFKEVSDLLSLDLDFEIEALGEGGIREFFRILQKKKNRKKAIKVLIFLGGILTNVITNTISDSVTGDSEFDILKKEETKLHIQKLKQDLDENDVESEQNVIVQNITYVMLNSDKIKFHRSRFYAQLMEEPRIEKISTTQLDELYQPTSEERFVERSSFSFFVLEKVEIEPEYIENAHIEIVAPVLNQRNMKWRGIYNDESFSFSMKDMMYKNDVLNGEISFTNGTAIKCTLEIERGMNENGEITITSYNVDDVMETFQGTIRTPTRTSKHKKEAENQGSLEFPSDNE